MDPLKKITDEINHKIEQRYVKSDYTDSYVAFLDILGMKNLVKKDYQDLRKIFNVVEVGKELYSNLGVPPGAKFISQDQVRMTIMSDSIVLSIDSSIDHAFSKVAGFSSYLIQNFLTALTFPVFLRGAIVRGLIFQDQNIVFGPALVDAHTLETNVASCMRCIIGKSLNSDETFIEYVATPTSALVKDPEDDMYFIKFVRKQNFKLLQEFAHEVLDSNESSKVKEKYKWLVRYIERERNA